MHSFTPWSVLRQFYSHFKSQFSTECHLVFPLSVSRIPSFTKGHKYLLTPSSSSFRHFCFSFIIPSITRVIRLFLFKMWLIQLGLLHFMLCRMFSSSSTLRNTSLFFTRSIQMIFCILLHHHVSKLSSYFWPTSWNCPSFSIIISYAPNAGFHYFLS